MRVLREIRPVCRRRNAARHEPQPHSRSRSNRWIASIAIVTSFCLGSSSGVADEPSREQMRSLDEQVQEIKSDVLGIAAELGRLEEKLLYPSNSQVAVFLSLSPEDALQLDSVEIEIDGEPVAHHIYSFKELEALRKGGVQRVYTGNVASGDHHLSVLVAGKLGSGTDFRSSESFGFSKEVEPRVLGLTLAEAGGAASIELGRR